MSWNEREIGADKGDTDTLSLSAFLPYRLSVLSNTVSRAIADDYDRAFGLTIWQWRCMAVLGETPGLTAREVAQRTAMDKVAVSRAIAALEGAGHLRRESDTRDARASHLFLTDEGRETYRAIIPIARRHEQALLGQLTPSEQAALEAILDKLARAAAPEQSLW